MKNIAIRTNLLRLATAFFLAFTMMGGMASALSTDMLVTGELTEVNNISFDQDIVTTEFVDFDSDYDEDVDIDFPGEEPMPWIDGMRWDDDMTYTTITGVVRDSDGNPVQNAYVNAESDWNYYDEPVFDDDEPMPDLMPETGENETQPEEIGEDNPMPEPINDADPVPPTQTARCMPFMGGGAETDENGEFSISVPEGYNYNLFVNVKGVSDSAVLGGFFKDADGGSDSDPGADNQWSGSTTPDWAEKTLIKADTEGVSGISITLGTGSKIYGKAIDTDGNPVKELWIDVSSELPGGWGGSATDEDGNFSIVIPPGKGYRVSSWPWEGGLMGGYWKVIEDSSLTASGQDGDLSPNWNEATLVDASEDVEINIIFQAGNTISGRVVDESGHPIPDIWVSAASGPLHRDGILEEEKLEYMDESGEYMDEMFFPEPFYFGASTDTDGYYEISVYPASEYRVNASGNRDYRTIYYKDATTWEDATLIDASEDSVSGIDFVLKTGPGISGVISGLKAGDMAHIEASSETRWGWGNVMVKGTDGSDVAFKIRGLEEGEYQINVWAEGYLSGYLQEDGTLARYDDAALIEVGAENVRITLDEGKKISGTVSGLSEGDRIWIDAYSESGWGKAGTEVIAEGPTAEFTLSGLGAASDFRVSVYADNYLNGSYGGPGSIPVSWEKAVLISTVDGDASGINILMTTGNTISGTITGLDEDKETYIYVNAWSDSSGSSGGVSVRGTGSEVTYEIKSLSPADDFRVSVNAEGYLSGYYSAEGTVGWEEADRVDSSSNPTNINIALSKGNTISGTITGLGEGEWAWIEARRENADRFIEPMPLIDIAMDEGMDMKYDGWCGTGGWGENSWGGISVAGTGGPVRYTITGLLPADDFIVTFRPEGYAVSTKTDIDTRTDPADIDFVVSEGKRMSGTIKGAVPGQWISVNAYSESLYDGRYAEVQADKEGTATYAMKGLGEASDYVVSAWSGRKNLFYDQQLSWEDATRVDVSVDSATGIDFDFDGIEMHTISGTIVGLPDKDDTQVWIDAWSETLGGWGNAEISGNGDFTIELPAGEYNLGIYADGYMNAHYDAESDALTDDWKAVERIALTDDVDLGELNLSAGYSISGAVTDSDGKALKGVWVEVFGTEKDIGTSAETDRNGEYSISGLSDGTYFVTVWSIDGYHEGEVTIEGSDVTYNITLGGEDTGEVSGVVSGGDVIMLFDESGTFVNAMETDDSGEYRFSGLPAGSYTVKLKKKDAEDFEVLETVTVGD